MRRLLEFVFGVFEVSVELADVVRLTFIAALGVPIFLGFIGLCLWGIGWFVATLIVEPALWHVYVVVIFCGVVWWKYFNTVPAPATPLRRGRAVSESRLKARPGRSVSFSPIAKTSATSKIRRGR
jgi:hypothetical protein